MTDKLTPEQLAEKYASQGATRGSPTTGNVWWTRYEGWLAGYRAALAEPAAATLSDEERRAHLRLICEYSNREADGCPTDETKAAIFNHIESLLASRLSAARRDALEEAAMICDERVQARLREHAYTEAGTGNTYYTGDRAEVLDAADDEAEEIRAAIRAKT